ncbi:hypothetical protein F4679DRAFT_580318 [Xylaria curta]|nr:hypothetical protein F4679DRAFT_580318 [Xylaria curta]
MDNPKPRTWQILKQWPRGCGKNQRMCEKTKRYCQQIPQGGALDSPTSEPRNQFAFEVPIRDLEPLQALNAFRRDLGLGRSSNLISSAIYDYDPTTIAECYEKSITDGFPRWPRYFPLAQQTEVGFVEYFTINSSTSNSSLSYQHGIDTRPSTAQHSG